MSAQSYNHRIHTQPDPSAPTLYVFHGTGGDENQFFDFGRQLRPDATIIAPRGDVSEGGALRYFRRTGEGVYDMDDLARRTEAMAEFVAATRGTGRVWGLGYSNGANILASVMFARPDLFDAAVLMHPLIPFTPEPRPDLGEARVLITAGARDPICPAPMTHALETLLNDFGASVELVMHEGGHEVRQDEIQAIGRFVQGL